MAVVCFVARGMEYKILFLLRLAIVSLHALLTVSL